MLIDTANSYTTAKKLGETLTPGFNIISKVITNDEIKYCENMCDRFYPVAKQEKVPDLPKIGNLGNLNNPKLEPVAWSCTDILRYETSMSSEPRNGY